MEYQATFDVSAPESEVERRIANCLAQASFIPVQGESVRYKRGSLLSASFSFSPLKAPTRLSAITTRCGPDSTQVCLLYDVSTKGSIVTEQDRGVWQTELESLQRAILTGDMAGGGEATQASTRAVGTAWRSLLLWFGIWLIVGLAVAIAGTLLTGNTAFTYIGIVAGCFVGYLVMQRYAKATRG